MRVGTRQRKDAGLCLLGPHKAAVPACFNESGLLELRINLSNLALGMKKKSLNPPAVFYQTHHYMGTTRYLCTAS